MLVPKIVILLVLDEPIFVRGQESPDAPSSPLDVFELVSCEWWAAIWRINARIDVVNAEPNLAQSPGAVIFDEVP